jgi:hypothetical protein
MMVIILLRIAIGLQRRNKQQIVDLRLDCNHFKSAVYYLYRVNGYAMGGRQMTVKEQLLEMLHSIAIQAIKAQQLDITEDDQNDKFLELLDDIENDVAKARDLSADLRCSMNEMKE